MGSKYESDIQQLYVTYLARPADPDGLRFWEAVVEASNGSTAALADAFATSAEYQQITSGMDAPRIVNNLYRSLFGYDADLAGLNFWAGGLSRGAFTVGQAAAAIVAGAQGSDLLTFQTKVAAAVDFTRTLDTPEKILTYQGFSGVIWGQYFLGEVTLDNPHPSFTPPVFSPHGMAIDLIGTRATDLGPAFNGPDLP